MSLHQTYNPSQQFTKLSEMTAANLDLFRQANAVLVKGLQQISQEVVSLTQISLESAAAAGKAVLSARSVQDIVAVNADYSRASIERFSANSAKLGELSLKVISDAFGPIRARATAAVMKAAA